MKYKNVLFNFCYTVPFYHVCTFTLNLESVMFWAPITQLVLIYIVFVFIVPPSSPTIPPSTQSSYGSDLELPFFLPHVLNNCNSRFYACSLFVTKHRVKQV